MTFDPHSLKRLRRSVQFTEQYPGDGPGKRPRRQPPGGGSIIEFHGVVVAAFNSASDATVRPVLAMNGTMPTTDVTVDNNYGLEGPADTQCAVRQRDDGSYCFTWFNCTTV